MQELCDYFHIEDSTKKNSFRICFLLVSPLQLLQGAARPATE